MTILWRLPLCFFVPYDVASPQSAEGRLFTASISRWTETARFPLGHLTAGLGEAGEIAAETAALLAAAGVDDAPFGDEEMACLAHFESQCLAPAAHSTATAPADAPATAAAAPAAVKRVWSIPAEEIARRRDYRDTRIFTIDPWNAKDLDDALHITRLPGGAADARDVLYEVRNGRVTCVRAHVCRTARHLATALTRLTWTNGRPVCVRSLTTSGGAGRVRGLGGSLVIAGSSFRPRFCQPRYPTYSGWRAHCGRVVLPTARNRAGCVREPPRDVSGARVRARAQ